MTPTAQGGSLHRHVADMFDPRPSEEALLDVLHLQPGTFRAVPARSET